MFTKALLDSSEGMNAVERLMAYTCGIFMENKDNPRFMQFAIRVPFDAYAIFGPEQWKDGAEKSDLHKKAIANIIESGIEQGLIPETDPYAAANSFWSVYVANVFEYSKLIAGTQEPFENDLKTLRNVVRFCFQGLGIEYEVWNSCLQKIINEKREGVNINESV